MALDTNTPTGLDSEITSSLQTLYWFNLGFALEWRVQAWNIWENIKQIQYDVAMLIEWNWKWWNYSAQEIKTEVSNALTEETLREISKLHDWYRQAVLSRLDDPAIVL